MTRDGVDRMFPFGKRDISEWGSRYEQKKTLIGDLKRFVGNFHVYQTSKNNCFIAAHAIGTHKALFNLSIYLL